jgi:hypothetical protein
LPDRVAAKTKGAKKAHFQIITLTPIFSGDKRCFSMEYRVAGARLPAMQDAMHAARHLTKSTMTGSADGSAQRPELHSKRVGRIEYFFLIAFGRLRLCESNLYRNLFQSLSQYLHS